MKTKLFIVSLFTIFAAPQMDAQWMQQTSGTSAPLSSIHCIDDITCFVVGTSTTVRKTVNGGINWTVVNTPGFTDKYCVKMYDKNKILIGQKNGTFLRTLDGGTTWPAAIPGGTVHAFYDIFYHTDSIFTAVGGSAGNHATGGRITSSSTNAGTSWTPINVSGEPTMFGIHCFNDTVCVAAAGAETVYKTTDGGANWTIKYSGTTASLFDVNFPTSTVGYAVGGSPSTPSSGGVAYKTTDTGETWNALTLPLPNTLYGVHFVNADTGFVVGNGGIIMKTENGGASWLQQVSTVAADLNKVIFLNDTTGYVSGAGGVILKTTNGGFPTGINAPGSVQNLYTLYGNPSRNEMKIELKFVLQNPGFTIFNELGQKQEIKAAISGNTISVNTSGFASGIYFFRLNDEGKNISGKFMVN